MSSSLIIHEANLLTHFPKQETRSIKIFVFSLDLNYKQEIIYLSLPFEWTNNDVTYNYQVHKIIRPLTSSRNMVVSGFIVGISEDFACGCPIFSVIFCSRYCLFALRFYGPVNPMGSCRARSVYLTTHLLGRLSPLSG